MPKLKDLDVYKLACPEVSDTVLFVVTGKSKTEMLRTVLNDGSNKPRVNELIQSWVHANKEPEVCKYACTVGKASIYEAVEGLEILIPNIVVMEKEED